MMKRKDENKIISIKKVAISRIKKKIVTQFIIRPLATATFYYHFILSDYKLKSVSLVVISSISSSAERHGMAIC